MATNLGQNWQNDLHSAGWHSETGRNMAVPIQKYCGYIVCKLGQNRSSNPRECEGNICTFFDEMAEIDISH